MIARLPADEAERLDALREHSILDTAPEAEFDDLVRLAAQVCGTPMAAISLIDSERQWFKAGLGLDTTETPRDVAFCAHTILQDGLMVVPDARADPRFADNPHVTGAPRIRFYAGAPLLTEGGHALGSLCVIDRNPRTLAPEQERALRALARQVALLLRATRRVAERERLVAERERLVQEKERLAAERGRAEEALARTHAALAESEASLRTVLESAPLILYAADADGTVTLSEGRGLTSLGLSPGEAVGRSVFEFSGGDPETAARTRCALAGEDVSYDAHVYGLCLHTELRPVRDADGEPSGIVGVCVDVTERMWAEERVRDHAVVLEFQESQREELERANAALEALATTDGLTGLKNHRALQERLAEEVGRAARYGTPLSLILLDVDRFKQYNDTFGHPAGDDVLRAVAHALRDVARAVDVVARYGGEEFVLILPQTDLDGAAALAERLRAAVEGCPWPVRAVTASFGVAALRVAEGGADLIARADAALYRSKAAGRNRVTCASGPAAPAGAFPGVRA